jgi:hypothetical protein
MHHGACPAVGDGDALSAYRLVFYDGVLEILVDDVREQE